MNIGTVVVKNKENVIEKTFRNVFDITTESGMFIIHYDVDKEWLYDESKYDYEIVSVPIDDSHPDYKSAYNDHIAIIKELENEISELRNTIVNMCKSAFGGANNEN